jgi:hypothetical protein
VIVRAYKEDPRFIAFAQKIGVMPKAARHSLKSVARLFSSR